MRELILGGARSGKSRYAQQLGSTNSNGKNVLFVATATADDAEMTARIAAHRRERPEQWQTIEEPIDLAGTVLKHVNEENFVIIDCLTMWMAKLQMIYADQFERCEPLQDFYEAQVKIKGDVIYVSNEISMGVVPMGADTRAFVDSMGRLHQFLAKQCDKVTLMVAGIPHPVKS